MSKAIDYANKHFNDAYVAYKQYGIYPLATLAQGAFESAYGTSGHASMRNNHFGITKGSSWKGETYKNPSNNLIFRVYKNPTDSFLDFGKLISKHYAPSLQVSEDITAYATSISQSRYISEVNGDNRSNYRNSIISIAREMENTVTELLKKKNL